MSVNATQPQHRPHATPPGTGSRVEETVIQAAMPGYDFGDGAFLSPEELIEWTARHLLDIDGRIRGLVSDINERKKLAAEFQRAIGRLDVAQSGSKQDPATGEKTFRDLAASAPPGPIRDAYTQVADGFAKGEPLSNTKLGALKQQLTGYMEELTGSAEITMLHVQKLVTERGHLLTLATNILRVADESAKGALANLR